MSRDLPDHVTEYNRTPIFTADTIPAKLLQDHNLKKGVWGKLTVYDGQVDYFPPDCSDPIHVKAGASCVIPPEQVHRISIADGTRFDVAFHQ